MLSRVTEPLNPSVVATTVKVRKQRLSPGAPNTNLLENGSLLPMAQPG